MKRYIALMLILAVAVSAIFSCGDSGNGGKNEVTTEAETVADVGEEEIPRENTPDTLPELDFNQTQINIYAFSRNDFIRDDITGDVVNEAVYRRYASVEERLNVQLNVVASAGWENYNSAINTIRSSILAGDNSYQIISGWSARIPSLAIEGLFMDLNELQYLNLSQPWWAQSLKEELTIGDSLYFATGDVVLSMLSSCSVMFFNKKVQSDHEIPDIYQLVLDGKWTLDKYSEIARMVSVDLDGNDKMDKDDKFGGGLTSYNVVDGFLQSCGIRMTKQDEFGFPVFEMEYDKMNSIVEKVYSIMYENPGVLGLKGEGDTTTALTTMFKSDRLFLMAGWLAFADGLRDMETDYGIIPYPKYDEAQEKYLSRMQDSLSLMCVPYNCDKKDEAGAVMEALGAEGYRKVSPVYFEVAMKVKYSRDEVSSQMLDIIRDGAYLTFASIYNESIGSPWHVLRTLMSDKNRNFASWYDKNANKIALAMEKVVDKLRENT